MTAAVTARWSRASRRAAGLGYAGAAPNAGLVDVDVIDDAGMAYVSDVIAGIDWVIANKGRYNIRVANLSFSAPAGSIRNNPLNDAVEKLWFSGVVVVASSGNYGSNGAKTTVRSSPANDPFIITVGAADMGSYQGISDDTMAPWSVWGSTADGFRKPDLAASRPLHGRARCRSSCDAVARAAVEHPHVGLHEALGHVVLRPGGGGRGRAAPRAASRVDARPGQGCAVAEGTPAAGLVANACRRLRRARRGRLGGGEQLRRTRTRA